MNNFQVASGKTEDGFFKWVHRSIETLEFQYMDYKNDSLVTAELNSNKLKKILDCNGYPYEVECVVWKNEYYNFEVEFSPYYHQRGKKAGEIKGYEGTIILLDKKS